MSQGMWAAFRNWKRQGNRLLLEPPERKAALLKLDFTPVS